MTNVRAGAAIKPAVPSTVAVASSSSAGVLPSPLPGVESISTSLAAATSTKLVCIPSATVAS